MQAVGEVAYIIIFMLLPLQVDQVGEALVVLVEAVMAHRERRIVVAEAAEEVIKLLVAMAAPASSSSAMPIRKSKLSIIF